jgi:hypothetical protein
MNIVINATAATTESVEAPEVKWVSKGGSTVVSENGRFSLRKNTKGVWRRFDGGILISEHDTKEAAKAAAEAQVAFEVQAPADLKAALVAGEAKVYNVREDGSLRRRHFLTGKALTSARKVQAMREAGNGMAVIAGELHVSVSQVRRILIDLALTEELEAADQAELEAMLTGASE